MSFNLIFNSFVSLINSLFVFHQDLCSNSRLSVQNKQTGKSFPVNQNTFWPFDENQMHFEISVFNLNIVNIAGFRGVETRPIDKQASGVARLGHISRPIWTNLATLGVYYTPVTGGWSPGQLGPLYKIPGSRGVMALDIVIEDLTEPGIS